MVKPFSCTSSKCIYTGYTILSQNKSFFRGYGQVQIDNSIGGDSYIKLVFSGKSVFFLFLAGGKKYTIKGINNGI